MSEFNVGDKVRITKTDSTWPEYVGEEGVILLLPDHSKKFANTTIKMDSTGTKMHFSVGHWEFELVEPAPVEYKITYPNIPDDVKKVKDKEDRVWKRHDSNNLWVTSHGAWQSEYTKNLIHFHGPLTPVKEPKYNIILVDPDGESFHSSGVSKDNACLFLQKILNSANTAYIKNYRLGEYLEYTDGLAYKVEEV